jgi:hypothetical protein
VKSLYATLVRLQHPRRQSAGPETHNPAMRGLESGYAALFQYVRDLSDTPGYGEVDIDAGSPFEL